MNKKLKTALRALVLLLLIVFTAWSVCSMFFVSGSGNMRVSRTVIFRYFTVDSNILCAVSCVFPLIEALRGRKAESGAVMLLRYAGTAAVTVTMMTVLLFLGPVYGYPSMFAGWNLWLHLLSPALAIVSFVWLERDGAALEKKHLPLSALPVIAYGIVYYVMVVAKGKENGGWPDFYGFNSSGKWYLAYVIMLAGTVLIGFVLMKLRNGQGKKTPGQTRRNDHVSVQ